VSRGWICRRLESPVTCGVSTAAVDPATSWDEPGCPPLAPGSCEPPGDCCAPPLAPGSDEPPGDYCAPPLAPGSCEPPVDVPPLAPGSYEAQGCASPVAPGNWEPPDCVPSPSRVHVGGAPPSCDPASSSCGCKPCNQSKSRAKSSKPDPNASAWSPRSGVRTLES
jgi:hypothetical protein